MIEKREIEGMMLTRTIVLHGNLIRRNLLLDAARKNETGLQLMTFEQLAARLAGGFSCGIENKILREAIRAALPDINLGELEPIKLLPGMIPAAAETLQKVWRANINLQSKSKDHPRIESIAKLEEAVIRQLPKTMKRPHDLVIEGLKRIHLAQSLFGAIQIIGITELSPVWIELLYALCKHTDVSWEAGPRSIPQWLDPNRIKINQTLPETPKIELVSAATAYHEAIEAVRWARELVSSGKARPEEIAIVSTMPNDYDDHFIALRSDANIDICFVHGVKVVTTRAGQAAAALADILVRGFSQSRIRRLSALLSGESEAFGSFPDGWIKILPQDAPLISKESWDKLLDRLKPHDWEDNTDHTENLKNIIHLIAKGTSAANEVGEKLLKGQSLTIWREALKIGSAAAIDIAINNLRMSEYMNAPVSIAWMPANELATAPRPYVRMLGLNSSKWPRGQSEDRLLSEHIINRKELDPLPINSADRRDFETILATTKKEVIMSRSRRDSEGRLLGKSPLLPSDREEGYIQRNKIPMHAMSETDRLSARPNEFAQTSQGQASFDCWRDWLSPQITKHDGLIRANHPVIEAILKRTQSASSLKLLLRYPLSFVWRYGLGLKEPDSAIEPIILEPSQLGDLIHMTLERALKSIQKSGGLAKAKEEKILAEIVAASDIVAQEWEVDMPTPPKLVWDLTLDEIKELSFNALTYAEDNITNMTSYCEVPFGGSHNDQDENYPWDPEKIVTIPNADFKISGYIDRLDVSSDQKTAVVRDYKTGTPPKPKDRDYKIKGGSELQRCLYAFAVKSLLGEETQVTASLFYPRAQLNLLLDNPDETLLRLEEFLKSARESMLSGACVIGPDINDKYDDFAFVLPANARAIYALKKLPLIKEKYVELAQVWEAE